jgi:hypothetical protein
MKTNVIYVADTSSMIYRPGPLVRTWKRQFKAAFRALALPDGPPWFRLVGWWVATPSGLFANFFTWFVGIHLWGPPFFVGWLFFSLFIPAAIVYHRTLTPPERVRKP